MQKYIKNLKDHTSILIALQKILHTFLFAQPIAQCAILVHNEGLPRIWCEKKK